MEDRKRRFTSPDQILPEIQNRVRTLIQATTFAGIHVFPNSSDVPDDWRMHLVVLPPAEPFSKTQNPVATKSALEMLNNRGDQPRLKRNRMLFLAADSEATARLDDLICSFKAWESIVKDFDHGESLRILFDTASQLGAIVGHQSGIRLCVLEVDGVRIVYAPTPRLVEESKPQSAEIVLSPNSGESLHEQILAPQSAAAASLTNTEVKAIENNLKESPPQDFDLARQVRVLSTEFQFVEFSLKGAALSRKRVDVPTDLLGLAPDAETEELLRANFQLIAKADEVSGESLLKRRAEIERKYLINIARYGAVILKSRACPARS